MEKQDQDWTQSAPGARTLLSALVESDSMPLRANCFLNGQSGFQHIITITRQQFAGSGLPSGRHFNYAVAFIKDGEIEGKAREFATIDDVALYIAERWGIAVYAAFNRWYSVDEHTMPYAEPWSNGKAFLRNPEKRPFVS